MRLGTTPTRRAGQTPAPVDIRGILTSAQRVEARGARDEVVNRQGCGTGDLRAASIEVVTHSKLFRRAAPILDPVIERERLVGRPGRAEDDEDVLTQS
jgi:hypothetical protein